MENNKISSEFKYYLYIVFKNLRFTRIINVIFIVQFLKLSLVQFAFFQSIFLFSQLISEVPSGILGDVFNKKKVVLLGLIMLTISPVLTISSAVVATKDYIYHILMATFVLEGVGNAFLSGADDALFFEALRSEGKQENYGKIRGKLQLICALTLGGATFLGGGLYSIKFYLPYLVQSFTLLCSIIIIMVTPDNQSLTVENHLQKDNQKFKELFSVFHRMIKSSRILFMFIFTTVTVSAINVVFTFLPNYFSTIGFSNSTNGAIFMAFSVIGGIVATQAYKISKIRISNLMQIISMILMVSIVFHILPHNTAFIISLLLLYIIIDIIDPIVMEMLHLWVDDESRATIISGLSFSISLVTMLMNPIIGVGVQMFKMKTTILLISIFIILMVLISYILIEKTKKKKQYKNS
ncbi:MFS transporter [Facklamia miroungae]|uniref:Fucose permease n=1 Tax=Facklamia miroungae TaxID=120956 RepID=A0A1G7TBM2_9LACT|nr:MFS transporter [Facklamia miroungae]NKZ29754.1 MFS transporter [Facklamia miroungae]SDG32716.1 Fucose permease [Facklamia miroungae]